MSRPVFFSQRPFSKQMVNNLISAFKFRLFLQALPLLAQATIISNSFAYVLAWRSLPTNLPQNKMNNFPLNWAIYAIISIELYEVNIVSLQNFRKQIGIILLVNSINVIV